MNTTENQPDENGPIPEAQTPAQSVRIADGHAAELTARANAMEKGDLTIASVGVIPAGVVLWLALPSGRTRRVILTDKQSLSLIRQVAAALEGRA